MLEHVKKEEYSKEKDVFKTTKDIVGLLKAPSPEIDKFDGNPLEYEYFKATFKEAVERVITDQEEKWRDSSSTQMGKRKS